MLTAAFDQGEGLRLATPGCAGWRAQVSVQVSASRRARWAWAS